MKLGLGRILARLKSSSEKSLVPDYSDPQYIRIFLKENGEQVSFAMDENIRALVSLSNAMLSEDSMSLIIPYQDIYIYYFDDEGNPINDYQLLNLPPLFDGIIFIENNGNYAEDDKVTYSFQFRDGKNHHIKRIRENVISVDGRENILPTEMYECLKLVTKYNQDESLARDTTAQFELLSKIKDYAERTNLALNQRLSIESKPIIIDKIKLDFVKTDSGLEIKPILENMSENFNNAFVSAFDHYADIKNFYNIKENGKDVKVIFKNKDSARKLKENRNLTGEKEKDFYRGHNELLEDSDNFDISNYGPRVKGLGYLNYRAIASPSQNNDESWFDFARAYEPPSLYTDELVHPWQPEDQEVLENKLKEMDHSQSAITELEIEHGGESYKVPMNKEQLTYEIEKIRNAIVDPRQIKSIHDLKEIKEKCKNDPNQLYIEHKGRYVKNFGLEMFEEQIKLLNEQGKNKPKQKDPMLIIKDNLEGLEFSQVVNEQEIHFGNPYETPRSLKINLFEHQIEGVRRLQNLYRVSNVNGFLLADDMGLGKTIQILAFLAWLKEKGELAPSLVVAPTTLINNWDNDDPHQPGEIQKFFLPNTFSTYKIQGVKKNSRIELDKINQCDLVFITYDSLRLNHVWLGKVKWSCIICDEVQYVKNPKTLVSVALKAQNGNFKIACSATPIENTTEDLWNIVDFALPGALGSLNDFKRHYVKPIDTLHHDQLEERKKLNDSLVQKIEKSFLRRSKEDKLPHLPRKKIEVHFIKANELEIERIEDLNRLRQLGEPPLALIQKLIACCSHPRLESADEVNLLPVKNLIEESSKLLYLKEILDEIKAKGEKAIIFTVFRQMQQILFKTIAHWYGIYPHILNGTLSSGKRTSILQDFRSSKGFNIIILSPLAAGVGITLTEANHVIHYTRLWNPAKEAQATDRVYRIGQQKDVHVYYPILTFDENRHLSFDSEDEYIDHFLTQSATGKTPDEKLNRLLVKKKNLLNNFFLAAGNTNIDIIDEWEETLNSNLSMDVETIEKTLKPYEFKAACSVLLRKMGYETYLLHKNVNSGADILVQKSGVYGLVQCLLKNEALNWDSNKIFESKTMYEKQLGIKIQELTVVTTANTIAEKNHSKNAITYRLHHELAEILNDTPLTYSEIIEEGTHRFTLEALRRELSYSTPLSQER